MQDYAENAVTQQMKEIQKTFFDHWGKQKPWKGKEDVLEQAIQRSSRYLQLREQGMSEEEIMKANLQVDRQNRPVWNDLHPLVYAAIVGLVLWFVASARPWVGWWG